MITYACTCSFEHFQAIGGDAAKCATCNPPSKNQIISRRILHHIAAGEDVATAYDLVLGVGAYRQMADDLHTALQEQSK